MLYFTDRNREYGNMKIVMTLLVRDEEDIIGQNIEFHLNNGVDFLIVTDNLSEDGTRDILEAYRRLGVLHYIYEPEDNYAQSVWVTRMAKLGVRQFGADWVINNDADEFWWAETKKDIKTVLQDVPDSFSGLNVRRHNFVYRPHTGDAGFLKTMVYRETVSVNGLGNRLPPKVCHRALPDFQISQGNHDVFVGRDRLFLGRTRLRLPVTDELCIFHFPMRSSAQFRNKIEKGGAAYARGTLSRRVGKVWKKLYKLHQRKGLEGYLDTQLYDDQRLHRALAKGELVEDQRLLRFFEENQLPVDSGRFSRGPDDQFVHEQKAS